MSALQEIAGNIEQYPKKIREAKEKKRYTISDIVDAVIGRLQSSNEADTNEALVVTREDGSLLVDGGLHVQELRELTGERLADVGSRVHSHCPVAPAPVSRPGAWWAMVRLRPAALAS